MYMYFIMIPFDKSTLYDNSVENWLSEQPTHIIVPTARFVGCECPLDDIPSVTVIHYSDHSNYN